MAIAAVLSNHAKYQLANKKIDLAADSIKVLLMRNGFTFDKDIRGKKINIKGSSGAISLTFVSGTKKITRGSGSFVTDGFVVGNQITTDATLNSGPFTITVVAALEITVSEAVVDEGPVTKTVTANDELQAGFGYTQDTKTLTTLVLTEDLANDRAELTCDDVSWTASGGAIGPTPGAILYDDSTTDDTILGYLSFGANQQAGDGADFVISVIVIRVS
jgi:hypothetical protein